MLCINKRLYRCHGCHRRHRCCRSCRCNRTYRCHRTYWCNRCYRSHRCCRSYRRNRTYRCHGSYRTYGCHRRSRNGVARRIGYQWHYGAVHRYRSHRLDGEQRCFGWASHCRRSGAQRFVSGATGIRCANAPDASSCPRQLLPAFLLCPRGRGSTGSDWQNHLYRHSRRRINCG